MKHFVLLSFCVVFIWSVAADKRNVRQSRIIGGDGAVAGEYPFSAAIYVSTLDSQFFCGGTLITNQWILTSAQCVYNAISFTIHLGSNYLEGNDPNRLILSTGESEIYPDFNPNTIENDIGLIKLRIPVEFTDYVRAIHFMPTYTLQNSAPTIAIGWGQISDEHPGLVNELNFVDLTTISNAECRFTYGSQITDNMVCVAGNYNEGSCIGDTGGPLVQYVGRGYYLNVGVASFVSGNGCESTDPSGYTRTFSYMSWIRNLTGV